MKDDKPYLQDIAERIRRIEILAQRGREVFLKSFEVQDAVIRSFEVIGEAAKPAL